MSKGFRHFTRVVLGYCLAGYLWFVRLTSRLSRRNEADPLAKLAGCEPFIATFWHGQHFMIGFAKGRHMRFKTLISRHGDGEINAVATRLMGIEAIRGAGDPKRKGPQKGGATSFRALLQTLARGYNVSLTADIPKIRGVCGMGIIKLAQKSGRPIVPLAYVTSRYITINSWDKASLHLPFSSIGFVIGEPVHVASDAGQEELEAKRQQVEATLNSITRQAYDNCGAKRPDIFSQTAYSSSSSRDASERTVLRAK
jgi:lysophospholipid acyltransferase (LPLAT)-like uncharacterized protein